MTVTAKADPEANSASSFVFGFAESTGAGLDQGSWVFRMTIPDIVLENITNGGYAHTFVGTATLTAGVSYYFGFSRE